MIKIIDICKNNSEKSFATTAGEHVPCGYSMNKWKFDSIQNDCVVYRGKGFMKKFCESLRDHAMNIINFEKKKTIPMTNKEYESYLKQCVTFAKKV